MPVKQAPPKQDDFWAGTSAPPAQTQGEAAPPAQNEDWKVWQQPDQESPSLMSMAGTMAKDLGKGVLESGAGTAYTLGAPVAWAAHKMGFANETPEQKEQQENLFKPTNATQAVGAGLGDALQSMVPVEKALPLLEKAGKMASDFVEPLTSKLSKFNQAWNPLPLKSRAINTLNEVGNAAKDVPVPMTMTNPAVKGFREFANTGGRNPKVMRQFAERLENGDEMNFPEARNFYSNISKASARPGFLRRAMENPMAAPTRYQLGGVREALGSDLTKSLEPLDMSDKYAQGIREFANASKLHRAAKIGGAIATEEALRRSGILGNIGTRIAGQ